MDAGGGKETSLGDKHYEISVLNFSKAKFLAAIPPS